MPNETIYLSAARRDRVVDQSGSALSSEFLPRLNFDEIATWRITVLDTDLDPVDLSHVATWKFATAADWDSGTIAGELNAALSAGAITSIQVKGLASAPPSTGLVALTNAGLDTESVWYSATSLEGGVYTLTVAATLAHSYAEDDAAVVDTSPPTTRALDDDIDATDSATGVIVPAIDTRNPVFLAAVNGKAAWVAITGELLGYDSDGLCVEVYQFPCLARGLVDPNTGDALPGPPSNYWTKSEADAKYAINPLTTKNDIIVADASGLMDRLAVGAAGQALVVDELGDIGWGEAGVNVFSALSDVNLSSVGTGDICYFSTGSGGGHNLVNLSLGTSGQLLTVIDNAIAWADAPASATEQEVLDGTETEIRSLSPAQLKLAAETHGGGGGGGGMAANRLTAKLLYGGI
jgi:hypothetical protein